MAFEVYIIGDIMMNKQEAGVACQMGDVIRRACDQIIHRNDIVPFGQQAFHQVAAQEPSAARHQYSHAR
jgi:hypothetical protein